MSKINTSGDLGILMVGGYTSQKYTQRYSGYYNPMTNFYCDLSIFPVPSATFTKYAHTVTGPYVIGGFPQTSSIIDYKFNMDKGAWDPIYGKANNSVQLVGHSAWKNNEGILLMGGRIMSPFDPIGRLDHTYLFHPDGNMVKKYTLVFPSLFSCAIDDTKSGTVILTGGSTNKTAADYYGNLDPHNNVLRYGEKGYKEDLPSMNFNRSKHGCGGYYDDGGILVNICKYCLST